jgi:hypothetical protein
MTVQALRLPLLPLALLASVQVWFVYKSATVAPPCPCCPAVLLRLPAAVVLRLRLGGPSKASTCSTRQLWVSPSSVSVSELSPLADSLLLLSEDAGEG